MKYMLPMLFTILLTLTFSKYLILFTHNMHIILQCQIAVLDLESVSWRSWKATKLSHYSTKR